MLKSVYLLIFITVIGKILGIVKDFLIVKVLSVSNLTDDFFMAANLSTLFFIMFYNSLPLINNHFMNSNIIIDRNSIVNLLLFIPIFLTFSSFFFVNYNVFIFLVIMSFTYYFSLSLSYFASVESFFSKTYIYVILPLLLNITFIFSLFIFENIFHTLLISVIIWTLIFFYYRRKFSYFTFLDSFVFKDFDFKTSISYCFNPCLLLFITFYFLYFPIFFLGDDEGGITIYNLALKIVVTLYLFFVLLLNSLFSNFFSKFKFNAFVYLYLFVSFISFLLFINSYFLFDLILSQSYFLIPDFIDDKFLSFLFMFICLLFLKEIIDRYMISFSLYLPLYILFLIITLFTLFYVFYKDLLIIVIFLNVYIIISSIYLHYSLKLKVISDNV